MCYVCKHSDIFQISAMGTTVPTSRLKLCLVLGVLAVEFN